MLKPLDKAKWDFSKAAHLLNRAGFGGTPQQIELFRKQATGYWLPLLVAMAKDPAMLVWLDQAQSRKEHPNENFAREVMELFTLGEGHYSEKDITEAARALTGWTFDRQNEQF